MRKIYFIIDILSKVAVYMSATILPIMMVIVLFEVVMRYIFNNPPMIADEFSGYMLVAMVFLGAAYTWKDNAHVRVTAFIERLTHRSRYILRLFGLILSLLFSIAICHGAYHFVQFTFKYGISSSTYFRTPLHIPHLMILIGFIILTLQIISDILKILLKHDN